MASIANIVVFDGAATPITHTLVPVSVGKQTDGTVLAVWREQIASLPVVAQIRCEKRQRVLKSGVVETRTRFVVPVMESVSGVNAFGYTAAPKVAFEDANEWVSYSHPRSTITSRRLAKQLLTNYSNNVIVTIPAATSGPFDEAVSQLIMPT
ncbi:coat protein [ssRNA phage SRR5467091_6]|uniref:Coat protein n=1 Tax=ssRNA phage SRR5467091_6 TaxID=2786471 RepID=A0A8S5L0E6_9VIRU|nr:coat protein [ssRNA phage SRR5467091_6]DAD50911.1 TPA_asm: coat protein [ssRNA phage SRR5467091_6]